MFQLACAVKERMEQVGIELKIVVECRVSWIVLDKLMRLGYITLVLLVHVLCCSLFGA